MLYQCSNLLIYSIFSVSFNVSLACINILYVSFTRIETLIKFIATLLVIFVFLSVSQMKRPWQFVSVSATENLEIFKPITITNFVAFLGIVRKFYTFLWRIY